jgi:hypothetical protein
MKQSKFVVAMELTSLAYMLLMIWILFPQWHAPLSKLARATVTRWRMGRDQVRFAPMPLWLQEAAQVRGRYSPPERAPRPLNLPL